MTSLNFDLDTNQSDHSQSLRSSPVARSIVSVWSVESSRVSEQDKFCCFKEEFWKCACHLVLVCVKMCSISLLCYAYLYGFCIPVPSNLKLYYSTEGVVVIHCLCKNLVQVKQLSKNRNWDAVPEKIKKYMYSSEDLYSFLPPDYSLFLIRLLTGMLKMLIK